MAVVLRDSCMQRRRLSFSNPRGLPMGHRAKAALVGATVRSMCQETRIRVTRRHLIRFIRLRPGRPAVNRVLHLRAAILILEADRHRVGILPAAAAAAVVEEAARAVVEAVAPL